MTVHKLRRVVVDAAAAAAAAAFSLFSSTVAVVFMLKTIETHCLRASLDSGPAFSF